MSIGHQHLLGADLIEVASAVAADLGIDGEATLRVARAAHALGLLPSAAPGRTDAAGTDGAAPTGTADGLTAAAMFSPVLAPAAGGLDIAASIKTLTGFLAQGTIPLDGVLARAASPSATTAEKTARSRAGSAADAASDGSKALYVVRSRSGAPRHLAVHEVDRGVAVVGSPGSGKTSCVQQVIEQVIEHRRRDRDAGAPPRPLVAFLASVEEAEAAAAAAADRGEPSILINPCDPTGPQVNLFCSTNAATDQSGARVRAFVSAALASNLLPDALDADDLTAALHLAVASIEATMIEVSESQPRGPSRGLGQDLANPLAEAASLLGVRGEAYRSEAISVAKLASYGQRPANVAVATALGHYASTIAMRQAAPEASTQAAAALETALDQRHLFAVTSGSEVLPSWRDLLDTAAVVFVAHPSSRDLAAHSTQAPLEFFDAYRQVLAASLADAAFLRMFQEPNGAFPTLLIDELGLFPRVEALGSHLGLLYANRGVHVFLTSQVRSHIDAVAIPGYTLLNLDRTA